MKVVIIGAGIGGLTLANYLIRNGVDVVVNERSIGNAGGGHAFLMHTDGLEILKELAKGSGMSLPGKLVNKFSLKRPDGNEVQCLRLNKWRCVKRTELATFLYKLLPMSVIRDDRKFTHFIYENDKIVAAAFANGEIEYGDIFVGADGGFSKVRERVMGPVDFQSGRVKEVVGIAYNKEIAQKYEGIFNKFQRNNNGLAFGIIPTSEEELVWFMQYDPSISEVENTSPEALSEFCHKLTQSFPPLVQDVLKSNDFSTSYIWNTRDFDLLPTFSHENVVLLGDAAHLALPFTSAGTTNAMVDAKVLAEKLSSSLSHQDAFKIYYDLRSTEVASHLKLGRGLRDIFLNPLSHTDDDFPVPLIADEVSKEKVPVKKPIEVLYFTDPICSTCWIIQPMIRKLKLEYGNYINIRYCMGGLLPSWNEYNAGIIKKPTDAAEHWEQACASHEMPMDGDVWIEDPLNSSYPPSIAFKAAQLQHPDKAVSFLRRIQEMVFLEKKNIIKWEFLNQAAFDNGLDSARLLRDFDGKAKTLFLEDLELAKEMEVFSFPTLFFSDGDGNQVKVKGLQPYEKLEEVILSLLPEARKTEIDTDPKSLFCHFPTMTDKEFSILSNMPKENAMEMLNALLHNGSIDRYESKNGMIWISKFDCVSCDSL
jgi:2-polyprenyl-6-methoxyphenol hydroxylase-like FAD-dependent oxidoreductase/predicted DsbA family dithiol-disulfide isomerase